VHLCRVEFWGGETAEFRIRLVAAFTARASEFRGVGVIDDIIFSAVGFEAAPPELIPSFDFDELHRRNASILSRRLSCN